MSYAFRFKRDVIQHLLTHCQIEFGDQSGAFGKMNDLINRKGAAAIMEPRQCFVMVHFKAFEMHDRLQCDGKGPILDNFAKRPNRFQGFLNKMRQAC